MTALRMKQTAMSLINQIDDNDTALMEKVFLFLYTNINSKRALPHDATEEIQATDIQKKQLARLEEMRMLEEGWDDEGAPPINEIIIETVEALIYQNKGQDLEQWIIFPDTNATLLLEAKHRDASISIGSKEFSYFYRGKEQYESADHEPLSIEKLTKVIRHINE